MGARVEFLCSAVQEPLAGGFALGMDSSGCMQAVMGTLQRDSDVGGQRQEGNPR